MFELGTEITALDCDAAPAGAVGCLLYWPRSLITLLQIEKILLDEREIAFWLFWWNNT